MNIYDIDKYLNKRESLWLSQGKIISNINQLKKNDTFKIFSKSSKKLSKKLYNVEKVYKEELIIKVSKGKYIYYDENIIILGEKDVKINNTTMMRELLRNMENNTLKIKIKK
tara:strand:+ start:477 stop:812 length:336 start_codon:yes stop_codon:yes gene_type:complete